MTSYAPNPKHNTLIIRKINRILFGLLEITPVYLHRRNQKDMQKEITYTNNKFILASEQKMNFSKEGLSLEMRWRETCIE